MKHKTLLTRYGLKFHPFLPGLHAEDIWVPPHAAVFFGRIDTLVREGGFALISGEPGLGKSKLLHALAHRLQRHADSLTVGVMERPQSSVTDFYRELGELFGVNLSPGNRYGGHKVLRARWKEHIDSTLTTPVFLVDEAQEMSTACLNEIRLLSSIHFDSECLLTTVLAGDSQLIDRFRHKALLPLATRIRVRFNIAPLDSEQMRILLEHVLEAAGAPQLMTDTLKSALAQQSAGSPRVMIQTAAELLHTAAERDAPQLDEALYLELCAGPTKQRKRRAT